jgi:hypothetical protein
MKQGVVVIHDLLQESVMSEINKVLLGASFPFYWHEDIDYPGDDTHNFGFSHELFNRRKEVFSNFVYLFEPILAAVVSKLDLKYGELLRMRAVLLTNTGISRTNKKHVDLDGDDFCTIVYYPHESDGDFYWYEEEVQNRVPIFPNMCVFMRGRVPHHGSNPISHPRRIAINANFTLSG